VDVRTGRRLAVTTGAVLLAGGAALVAWPAGPEPVAAVAPVAAVVSAPAPVPVAPASAVSSSPATSPTAAAAPASVGRVVVGDLVDVPLVETVRPGPDGVVTPTTSTAAARVEGVGAATVVAMHAGPPGAPGTALSRGGEPTVHVGDRVEVDGRQAVVTRVVVAPKGAAYAVVGAATWADPAAVIIVTCRPQGQPVAADNVAIVATTE